jgi:hypothetical protein
MTGRICEDPPTAAWMGGTHGPRVPDSSDCKPHPTRQREVGQHTDLVLRRLAKDDGREVVLSADLSRRL